MSQETSIHPLRAWREKAGKTQKQCAAAVGSTRQAWYEWEHGSRVPNKTFMPKVLGLTGGEITVADFYPQLSSDAETASATSHNPSLCSPTDNVPTGDGLKGGGVKVAPSDRVNGGARDELSRAG